MIFKYESVTVVFLFFSFRYYLSGVSLLSSARKGCDVMVWDQPEPEPSLQWCGNGDGSWEPLIHQLHLTSMSQLPPPQLSVRPRIGLNSFYVAHCRSRYSRSAGGVVAAGLFWAISPRDSELTSLICRAVHGRELESSSGLGVSCCLDPLSQLQRSLPIRPSYPISSRIVRTPSDPSNQRSWRFRNARNVRARCGTNMKACNTRSIKKCSATEACQLFLTEVKSLALTSITFSTICPSCPTLGRVVSNCFQCSFNWRSRRFRNARN